MEVRSAPGGGQSGFANQEVARTAAELTRLAEGLQGQVAGFTL
jgi:hypothetical protein